MNEEKMKQLIELLTGLKKYEWKRISAAVEKAYILEANRIKLSNKAVRERMEIELEGFLEPCDMSSKEDDRNYVKVPLSSFYFMDPIKQKNLEHRKNNAPNEVATQIEASIEARGLEISLD